MFRNSISILAAIAVFTTLTAAGAQTATKGSGMYGTLRVGTAYLSSSTIDDGTATTTEMETSTGLNFSAAVGIEIAKSIRIEGEIARTSNEVDQFLDANGIKGATGDVSSFAFLANGYYDFPVLFQKTSPYVTFGAGLINVSFDNVVSNNALFSNSDDIAFAWQFGGGIEYRFKAKMRLIGEYRYLGTTGLSFTDASSKAFNADYDLHTFRIGVRMSF